LVDIRVAGWIFAPRKLLPAQNAGGLYKTWRQLLAKVWWRPVRPAHFGTDRAFFNY